MVSSWLSCKMGHHLWRGEAAKQTKMVLRHPDGVETECLGQKRLGQHFAEKLLWVPASRPVGWGGIREREVAELHACTLLARWEVWRACAQRLANFQHHLHEAPFQRVRKLLNEFQTCIVPKCYHVGYTQEPPDTEIDNRR